MSDWRVIEKLEAVPCLPDKKCPHCRGAGYTEHHGLELKCCCTVSGWKAVPVPPLQTIDIKLEIKP